MRLLHGVLVLYLMVPAASAASPFYLGTWKISSAKVASWWEDRAHQPSAAEMKGLVGKSITITPKGIAGPRELACTGVRYEVKEYPADMLFQGAFDEMRRRDPSVSRKSSRRMSDSKAHDGKRWRRVAPWRSTITSSMKAPPRSASTTTSTL
jgi:hypothetical protein